MIRKYVMMKNTSIYAVYYIKEKIIYYNLNFIGTMKLFRLK